MLKNVAQKNPDPYMGITKDLLERVEARLRAARTKMLFHKNWAFFGYLSMHLKITPVPGMMTTATDGENFLYDPVALDAESVEWMEFDWAHEVLHLVGLDLTRAPRNDIMVQIGKGPPIPLWNLACDLWINLTCETEGFTVPPFVPIDRKYKGWSKDQIYEDLRKQAKKNGSKGLPQGRMCGGCKAPPKKKGQGKGPKGKGKDQKGQKPQFSAKDLQEWKPNKEMIEKWKMRAKEALEAAKAKGHAPGFAQTAVEKLLTSKQDWRSVLWQFCTRTAKEWRFTPPSRTGAARGLVLPRLVPDDEIEHAVIAIDTSGSISDMDLEEFLSETEAICTMARMKVTVLHCDAAVQDVFHFEPGDFAWSKIAEFKGRGGTAFEPVFDRIKEEQILPTFLLYFTDTWGSFPKDPPEYPVLWASTYPDGKVPWGDYISLREEAI